MADDTTHSRFGGSKCSRWRNCPGSVALCDSVPRRPSSRFAAEGTWAHALLAYCLEQGYDTADSFIHTSLPFSVDVPPQHSGQVCGPNMVAAVNTALAEVFAELALSSDAEVSVEQAFEIPLDSAAPGEVFGSNDCLVYHPSLGRLRIFDYKHGEGVSVTADDNDQLKFYALGALLSNPTWKVSEVVLSIVQPRARDADEIGAVRDWTFDLLEILEFRAEIDAAVAKAKAAGESPGMVVGDDIKTGPWCRWCDAAPVCPAKAQEALTAATVDFADITLVDAAALPKPAEIDVERLAKVVAGLDVLTRWASQCQEYLEGLVLSGVAVPGWKAVEKIGRAKWVDEPAKVAAYAELMFGLDADQVMPRKLATIGDVEKQLKAAGATKDEIDAFKIAYTIKESSGLTIAPVSDRRPAVDAATETFGAVSI